MNKERLEVDVKEIIISHVKVSRKLPVGKKMDMFQPAEYNFSERQFDDMSLDLVRYINRNNRHDQKPTNF